MKIFVSPHNDDECLFGAFTLMRNKPLVIIVTDSYIQEKRGDGITSRQRREETINAMIKLGCPVAFLNIPDDKITEELVIKKLEQFKDCFAYIPCVYDNGHPHHNIVGEAGMKVFKNFKKYHTYKQGHNLREEGKVVDHTEEEMTLKLQALECYKSQINLGATKPYFYTNNEEYYEA